MSQNKFKIELGVLIVHALADGLDHEKVLTVLRERLEFEEQMKIANHMQIAQLALANVR